MSNALTALDPVLDAVPGTVSVWCGRPRGEPAYARMEHATHYAASTMKVAVLAALYRAADEGVIDLDGPVPVRNEFASAAPGAPVFGCDPREDNDPAVWDRVGATATPRWLAHRMIVRSSNLATNHLLALVGLAAVADVWRGAGARHSVVGRGIEDFAAREHGATNLVTAADLAALFAMIATRTDPSGREMLEILLAQERGEDLAAGLPPGTRIAHKNGWITGIRHGAGVVFPDDAPPYVVVICATTPLAGSDDARPDDAGPDDAGSDDAGPDEACQLLARVAAASWADRHDFNGGP